MTLTLKILCVACALFIFAGMTYDIGLHATAYSMAIVALTVFAAGPFAVHAFGKEKN